MYFVLPNRRVAAATKPTETMTKVCIVYYSLYGHIRGFAESVKEGIESSGATCDVSCLFAEKCCALIAILIASYSEF
jgi:hypothetical protein